MSSFQKLPLVLALALCLSACGGAPAGTAPGAAAPRSAQKWKPESAGRVEADEAEASPTDGLEGSYYNDYLRMLLRLDGRGGCSLTGGGVDAYGSYATDGGALALDFGSRRESAALDGDGDVTLRGYSGFFMREGDFWGVTQEETDAAGVRVSMLCETLQLGDGKQRCRDFENEIAFTYTDEITVLPDRLADTAAATDGAGGYVTGRNVTAALAAFDGTSEAFLESYIRTYTFADFAVFFGTPTDFDPPQSASGKVKGRLAAASVRIRGAENAADARVLLYTSTYPDGTENYICKTYLAPDGDTARLDALETAVTDMSAVRMREAP